MKQTACGSPGCLVDRLEKTLKQELALSREFVGQIVTTQIESVKSDLSKIQDNVTSLCEDLSDKESRLIVLETKDRGRAWMKGIASQVLASVITSVVIGAGIYFLFIYKIHP